MYATQRRKLFAAALIFLAILACNYPKPSPATPDNSGTAAADTLASIETGDAYTQAAAFADITSTVIPGTFSAQSTTLPSNQNPLVVQDSLCWVGPGNQYEVVSAIKTGNRVPLLGRGTIPDWYIVRNPIYGDPCWIPASNLQIDASLNLSALPYFSPPDTPTPTPTRTPSSTAIPPSPTKTP